MRSQTCAATRRSWVMNSTARLKRLRTSSSSSSTCACTETSSAETGSSAISSSGSMASARAMQMRWRWPPENWCGIALERVGIEPARARISLRARVERLVARHAEVHRPLDDRGADRAARIERAIGVLEHDLHALAVRPQRARPSSVATSAPSMQDRAVGRLDQARDAARHRRLARAGLADDAERLAAADLRGRRPRRPCTSRRFAKKPPRHVGLVRAVRSAARSAPP